MRAFLCIDSQIPVVTFPQNLFAQFVFKYNTTYLNTYSELKILYGIIGQLKSQMRAFPYLDLWIPVVDTPTCKCVCLVLPYCYLKINTFMYFKISLLYIEISSKLKLSQIIWKRVISQTEFTIRMIKIFIYLNTLNQTYLFTYHCYTIFSS